ncbi:MAG: LexA family protein [Candidatus Arsenophonus phytopathogenicus]
MYNLNMKMKWYELAKSLMKDKGITYDDLAERFSVSKGAVSHWMTGKREPSLQYIASILAYVGINNPTIISDGMISVDKADIVKGIPVFEYPLLTKEQTRALITEDMKFTEKNGIKWIPSTKKASDGAFWYKVEGHSMTAPQGGNPSFPEGILILVDPNESVKDGDFCVASIYIHEFTFKRLIHYSGMLYLEPLNPKFENIPCNGNCKIIGKVVKSQWPDYIF